MFSSHVPQQLFVALLPLRFRGGELDLPVHVIDLLVAVAGEISRAPASET